MGEVLKFPEKRSWFVTAPGGIKTREGCKFVAEFDNQLGAETAMMAIRLCRNSDAFFAHIGKLNEQGLLSDADWQKILEIVEDDFG